MFQCSFKFWIFAGERPYKCHIPECGRAFIQLSNLQQHLRNHESQIERLKNRPFHCNICGKGFATESSLRTHTGKVSREDDEKDEEELVHHRIVQNVVLFQASNSIWMTIKLLFVFMFALFAVEHGKFDQSREFQLSIKLSEFRPKLVQAFKPIYIQASPKSDPLKSVLKC